MSKFWDINYTIKSEGQIMNLTGRIATDKMGEEEYYKAVDADYPDNKYNGVYGEDRYEERAILKAVRSWMEDNCFFEQVFEMPQLYHWEQSLKHSFNVYRQSK